MKKFSIVTVCFNEEKGITKTIESVLAQEFKDYEYIIIDGGSEDSTFDIIKSYQDRFANIGVDYNVISESDRGIYDAMNKGINKANSEWILFLNAGDSFKNKEVLTLVNNETFTTAEIIYGYTIFRNDDFFRYAMPMPIEHIKLGLPFCHQSVFVKTQLMKKVPFDTSYKIAADYDFFLRSYLNNLSFKCIDVCVSIFSFGGISSAHKYCFLMGLEYIKIRYKYGIISFPLYITLRLNLFFKKVLSKVKRCIFKIIGVNCKKDQFYLYDKRWVKGLENLRELTHVQKD